VIRVPDVSWSDDHGAYRAEYDHCAPSVAVAAAVNTALDDWDEPLFEYVDPDALDALVDDASTTLMTRFDVEDATVIVRDDGHVLVQT